MGNAALLPVLPTPFAPTDPRRQEIIDNGVWGIKLKWVGDKTRASEAANLVYWSQRHPRYREQQSCPARPNKVKANGLKTVTPRK